MAMAKPYEEEVRRALEAATDEEARWRRAAGIRIDGLPDGVDPADIEFEVRVKFLSDGEDVAGVVDCYRASWTHDGVFVVAECPDLERLSRLILRAFHYGAAATPDA